MRTFKWLLCIALVGAGCGSSSGSSSSGGSSGSTGSAGSSTGGSSTSGSSGAGGSSGSTGGTRVCPAYPLPPDASCTGVPAGYALTTANGDFTTSEDGQHIDGLLITGNLNVENANVTVTNTRVMGRVSNDATGGLVITDSDIGPDTCSASGNPYDNLGGTNYTLIRSHVHNAGSDLMGMGGTGTILIQDSIVNQACYYDGDHLDAIQFYAPGDVGQVTIEHTVLDSRAVNTSNTGNSAIFWADTPGSGSHLTVKHSFFAGGGYSTCFYDASQGSGVIIDAEENTYTKDSYQYGPCASSNSIDFNGTEGLIFKNNVLDDGTPISGC